MDFFGKVAKAYKANGNKPVTFYDSVCGIPLFNVPMNRTLAEFMAETKEHGPEHTKTLRAKLDLAFLLQSLEERGEARGLYEAVIEGFTKQLGPEHTSTLLAKYNLGCLESLAGNYDAALELIEGYDVDWAWQDEDLAPLRQAP